MTWPTPQEYNEAIQNYATTFTNVDLRLGCPEETPLGLPRPISGMFASVYKFQGSHKTWAVRCFLREVADAQERYQAISRHLAQFKVPYVVDFDYLEQGIHIGAQWYPILKMEWVDGETLSNYIRNQLNNRDNLLDLAQQWLSMTDSLRAAQIAHGDLQHGNVIVVQGKLRLVDYDGMFVPTLHGYISHELGHRNYQHPRRREHHFSPDIDNFSSWVVYVALVALSADPQLWQRFNGGDECLLLRQKDFEEPQHSQVLKVLTGSTDPHVRATADLFCSLLPLDPLTIPSPSELMNPPVVSVVSSAQSAAWFEDYIDTSTKAIPPAQAVIASTTPDNSLLSTVGFSSNPSWILDGLTSQVKTIRPVQFEYNVRVERLILLISLLMVTVAFAVSAVVSMPLVYLILTVSILAISNLMVWTWRYHLDPAVLKRNEAALPFRSLDRRLQELDREIDVQKKFQGKVEYRYATDAVRIKKAKEQANERQQRSLQSAQYDVDRRHNV